MPLKGFKGRELAAFVCTVCVVEVQPGRFVHEGVIIVAAVWCGRLQEVLVVRRGGVRRRLEAVVVRAAPRVFLLDVKDVLCVELVEGLEGLGDLVHAVAEAGGLGRGDRDCLRLVH